MQDSTPTNLPTSPLTEVDPDSLNELMARDPLELSGQNIQTIVQALRSQRIIWERDEKAKPKKATAKTKISTEEAKALLDGLELDL